VSSLYNSLPPLFRPRPGQDVPHPDTSSKVPAAPSKLSYAFPWPDHVEGLGHRRVDAFDRCARCSAGSWVRYGTTVLCVTCAKRVTP
jgi:hypothetical protein